MNIPIATVAPPVLPGAPAGAGPSDLGGDFLAAIQEALGAAAPVVKPAETPTTATPGFVTVAAQPPQPADEPGFVTVAAQPPQPADDPGFVTVAAQPPQPADEPAVEPAETPAADLPNATPLILDPALAALVAQQSPPVHVRTDPLPERTPELAVAGANARTKERLSVPAEAVLPPLAPTAPATANQPEAAAAQQPQPQQPAIAPISAAPVPLTATVAAVPATHAPSTQLDRVSAQVFPEVTGLVSRGNGTHRITLSLNPENLGEVRVVMTMRAGAVHVRLAAGQEARASLLDGSAELGRLLERAGATEARVVVRELAGTAAPAPAAPSTSTTASTEANLGLGSGDRSPDQHAGTRADHPATDGSDHNAPRSARTAGTTAALAEQRSIQSVIGSRTAGVDLTM